MRNEGKKWKMEKHREGSEPENQAARMQWKRVQPRLPLGSSQHTVLGMGHGDA